MNMTPDKTFGQLTRKKREALKLSQAALARQLKWPQAKVSRVEQGKRSVTLPEMLTLAQTFHCSVNELLGELDCQAAVNNQPNHQDAQLTPGFFAVYADENALWTQLERYGVKFLGGSRHPVLVNLAVDEVVLAALRFAHDPRLFESLPALLLRNAERLDWTKLMSGAYSLQLQNRLGMVVAATLSMQASARGVDEKTWKTLQEVHDSLAEAKLDKEDLVGPRPQTQTALSVLRRRTPKWLRFWHVLGYTDLESFKRYLLR